MTREANRIRYIDPEGQPITIIQMDRGNGGADRDETVSAFRIRRGNQELTVKDNEKDARKFAEDIGGVEISNSAAQLVAAEIDGTAAHQAAHAEDTERLAKLIEDAIDRREKGETARTAERPTARTRKVAAEARAEAERMDNLPDDSQASGVAPMDLGLAPHAPSTLVERVPGAAEGK